VWRSLTFFALGGAVTRGFNVNCRYLQRALFGVALVQTTTGCVCWFALGAPFGLFFASIWFSGHTGFSWLSYRVSACHVANMLRVLILQTSGSLAPVVWLAPSVDGCLHAAPTVADMYVCIACGCSLLQRSHPSASLWYRSSGELVCAATSGSSGNAGKGWFLDPDVRNALNASLLGSRWPAARRQTSAFGAGGLGGGSNDDAAFQQQHVAWMPCVWTRYNLQTSLRVYAAWISTMCYRGCWLARRVFANASALCLRVKTIA